MPSAAIEEEEQDILKSTEDQVGTQPINYDPLLTSTEYLLPHQNAIKRLKLKQEKIQNSTSTIADSEDGKADITSSLPSIESLFSSDIPKPLSDELNLSDIREFCTENMLQMVTESALHDALDSTASDNKLFSAGEVSQQKQVCHF